MQHEPMPESAEESGILAREGMASIAYVRQSGPAATVLPGIIFLGGFRSDMTGIKATHLGRFARNRGQAFVRFDYRGHGADAAALRPAHGRRLDPGRHRRARPIDAGAADPGRLLHGRWIMQHVALARPERIAGLVGIASANDFTERLMWAKLPDDFRARLAADGCITLPSRYDPAGYGHRRRADRGGTAPSAAARPDPDPLPGPPVARHPGPGRALAAHRRTGGGTRQPDVVVTLIKDGDHRLSEPGHLALIEAAVAELSHGT